MVGDSTHVEVTRCLEMRDQEVKSKKDAKTNWLSVNILPLNIREYGSLIKRRNLRKSISKG